MKEVKISKQDSWIRISMKNSVATINLTEGKHLLIDLQNVIEKLEREEELHHQGLIAFIKQGGEG